MTSQIIAIGGGGFSTESEPGLDSYLLQQCQSKTPRIGFVGTASGDSERYRLRFYSRFSGLQCIPSHLEFFGRTPDLEKWALNQDLIFVGGGNTKSLIAVWKEWGFDETLKTALEEGVILAGISAGAICWFQSGVTDSFDADLLPIDCFGFLEGSCCPHYSEEPARRPRYLELVGKSKIEDGYAIDDRCAVHYIDGVARKIVRGAPGASAYRVLHVGGSAVESEISEAELIDVAT